MSDVCHNICIPIHAKQTSKHNKAYIFKIEYESKDMQSRWKIIKYEILLLLLLYAGRRWIKDFTNVIFQNICACVAVLNYWKATKR